jgi:LuxR family maltose regulon positive regulatory protein
MPRAPRHLLSWSAERTLYELYTHGQLVERFRPEDDALWLRWLDAQPSFTFQGAAGRLAAYQEARSGGARYWYAYQTSGRRTGKRYLGRTNKLTLARLEQVAHDLSGARLAAPYASVPALPAALAQADTSAQAAPVGAGQNLALLGAKLSHPRLPTALVARERLLQQLDTALDHPLTLLSASAGWGKTTLLSAWLHQAKLRMENEEWRKLDTPGNSLFSIQHSQFKAAWVSLDALDADPTRFWITLIAALRRSMPTIGVSALAMLQAPQPPPLTAVLTGLLNELSLAERRAPLVLILDDYHTIDEPAIHESLSFALEHLPAHMHLVLSSRVDPDLPLARWRVRGQLLEIRAADLRFTESEAASFFRQAMGDVLGDDDVGRLELRTEGWVAGLQLAALAMRQRADLPAFVSRFTGSHRYLVDYVQEEILQRQPEPVQRFLLRVAVLSRMNAALCRALTDEPASQAMLERLERNNLFVVPLDEQRQWYRMHDLFREVLLARLQATAPELAPYLHQRAAQWYAAQGELREAIPHALAGHDFAYAAGLIERVAEELWLHGEIQTLYRWVMALPDAVVLVQAALVLTAALYVLNVAMSTVSPQRAQLEAEAKQLMARVEAALRQPDSAGVSPEAERLIRRRLRLLQLWSAAREATRKGDVLQLRNIYEQHLQLDQDDLVSWQVIPLHLTFWLHEMWLRDGTLVPLLQDAKQRVTASGDRFATIRVVRWLAIAYLRAGRLREAHQESLAGLDLLEQLGGHTILAGYFHACLAEVLFKRNDLEAARARLRQQIRDAEAWQHVDLQMLGYVDLIRVEGAAGKLAEVQSALQKVEQVAQREGSRIHGLFLTNARLYAWLAEGNLDAADEWAAGVVFDPEAWNPNRKWEFLLLVWISLARQEHTGALAALQRFRAHLDHPGDVAITIDFLALYAIALHQAGDREQTRAIMARLLALTEPEGYLQVYLEKGDLMRPVLQDMLVAARAQDVASPPASIAFVGKLLGLFELRGRRDAAPATETSPRPPQPQPAEPATTTAAPALVEPLTQRELEVLRLLASGASNQEIADRLVISLATVKKHVSNLLGKLQVESRTQAIARVRESSLLG